MKKLAVILIALLLFVLSIASAMALIINEIMYNPAGNDTGREWVEVYYDSFVDLSNWTVGDIASNNTLIQLKRANSSYALIVETGFDFSAINASVYSAGAAIGNGLGNSGDSVYLYDKNKTSVAFATYNGSLANGNNKSLELYNGSWLESLINEGTPGRKNSVLGLQNNSYFNSTNATFNITTSNQTSNSTNTSINSTTNTTQTASGSNQTNPQACDVSISIKSTKDIYDYGESIKFSNILSNDSFPFKIEYWIEDLFGGIVKSKYATENLNQKSYTPKVHEKEKAFIIKSDLFVGCDSNISDNHAEKVVVVKGDNTAVQEDVPAISEQQPAQQKFSYSIISYPGIIESGSEFSVFVKITNDENPHIVAVTSYVYKNSKRFSEESLQEEKFEAGEEKAIELRNVVDAAPGSYRLKVKIRKDSLATEYDITKNITVSYAGNINDSINSTKAYPSISQEAIKPNASAENKTPVKNATMAYEENSRQDSILKYLIIGVLVVISAVLIWKR